ncbi:MAG: ATP-grasp domain-containing protein [Actinomycetes bacterium]
MTTSHLAAEGGLLSGPAALQFVLLTGLGLLVVATAWRVVRLTRVRRGVTGGLTDVDPAVRVAAVRQAAELGLATTAPALLRAVRAEKDPEVVATVIETVAGRQWEPASTSAVVQLRLWVRAYLDTHPELRSRRAGAPPLLAGVAGATPPPALDPQRAARFQRGADVVGEQVTTAPTATAVDPDPLHRTTVLVTGAGGAAGVAVIRTLQERGHRVIGVDADEHAVGLALADEPHLVPRGDDPHFLAALLRVATVTGAQALMCTVAEEYAALSGSTQYLDEAGVRTLMPSKEAVDTCLDKWAFHQAMTAAGLPVPQTGLGKAEGVPGPWVVKPRFGRGSRDVRVATNQQQLRVAISATPGPLVQTQLTGREFTADVLVDDSGAVLAVCPRWRLETRAGISTKGETFVDEEVANVVSLVVKACGIVGPANVQGFVAEDGAVTVHEVNPRFSGGLPLTVHAGADLVTEYLRAILGVGARPERLVPRPGVRMARYLAEVYSG